MARRSSYGCVCQTETYVIRRNRHESEVYNTPPPPPSLTLEWVCAALFACACIFATNAAHAQANSCAAVIHGTECMDECPAGFTATTQNRVCIESARIDGANKCEAKGWTTRLSTGFVSLSVCLIKNNDTSINSGSLDFCVLGGASGCTRIFGPNLDFPQRPADDPATAEDESDPRYVFNCDPDGTTGHLPETFADGRTMCECPAGETENADGVCAVCPAQTILLGDACVANTPENRCKAAGWTVSADNQCVIPLLSPDGEEDGCFLDGNGSPQCADVFGPDPSFPNPSTDTAARFVYNCGPNMIPPRENTDGATACARNPQACEFSEIASTYTDQERAQQVSMQFDACAAKGWGARKHPAFDSGFDVCYCDINVRDATTASTCPDPDLSSRFSLADGNTTLRHYFGPTLQYLPQWTAENADDCFVAYCQDGMEPSGFNTNGATECQTPSGPVCGSLNPPQVYNGFVCVATCSTAATLATLNEATNTCECSTGNAADCRVPSAEVCAELMPPRFYNAGAARCDPFLTCEHPTELRETSNTCECVSSYVKTSSGCQMPSPAVCGELSGAQTSLFFDGTTCVAGHRCPATTHPSTGSRRCECDEQGKVYDAAAQACVVAISCAAPATLSAETGQCACASPNEGTASDCRAPSAQVCAGLMPPKFFDVSETVCVDIPECAGAATLNRDANRCECDAPNIGMASDCKAPSAQVCADLTQPKFFREGVCVDFVSCDAPLVLDEATNTCVSADINLRLRIFLEGPLR